MQKLKSILAGIAIVLFILPGCNRKEDNPTALIAGTANKTWHPEKETNAAGEKEKLSDEEKKESWTFYTNGTMTMNQTTGAIKGSWSYDAAGKTLTITPEGDPTARQFTVEDLTGNKMKLKAPDGSGMKLEAAD